MNQRKQNGQSQGNVNRGTVMKMNHVAFRLGPTLRWRQLLFVLPLLMTSFFAHADQVDGQTRVLMHSFVLEFAKMSPYLASEQAFTSEKGKAVVGESLKILANKVKNPPPKLERSPGFRITYGLLADHLQKTQEVFAAGEMEYARMRVNGIGNLCAACHMQAPKISHFSAFEFIAERSHDVTFENAEFLFVIRRYDEALAMFDKLVRGYPKGPLTSDQLNEAYRHKLAIFARVYRDPVMATGNLQTDLKNSALPIDLRQNIGSWIEALDKWKNEKVNPATMKTPELLNFVANNLPTDMGRRIAPDHPQLLNLLRMSGLLYERLYSEPDGPRTQELLFDLARCERSLAPLYWYPVSEIYLKECITQYPKKSYSKKCYDAYREGMQERYFGKPIPEGVQQSLEALKSYL